MNRDIRVAFRVKRISLIIGRGPEEVDPRDSPRLASRSASDAGGSSAGGKRPKFGVFSGGRHVLVKYAPPGDRGSVRRWRDLLRCDWKALQTVATSGRPAAFSLAALNSEYLGTLGTWTELVAFLEPPLAVVRHAPHDPGAPGATASRHPPDQVTVGERRSATLERTPPRLTATPRMRPPGTAAGSAIHRKAPRPR